jgi:predicted amidohydrolase
MLTFDADGALRRTHRKLVPTYTERLVWGPGDGGGLDAVETAVGRVGSLICWEHWMPLARQAVHESGEQIHVAVWPRVHEMHLLASRHYAFEGRCFVLAIGQILYRSDVPETFELPPGTPEMLLDGGSAIIGPDGVVMAGPVFGEESILLADLDLARIDEESLTLDVTGHYSRPDVLRLDRRRP